MRRRHEALRRVSCRAYEDENASGTTPSNGLRVFICNNGITMKKGYELFEDRLHLAGNYCEVQYQTGLSVWAMRDERYRLNDKNDSVVKSFIDTLNASEFMLFVSMVTPLAPL